MVFTYEVVLDAWRGFWTRLPSGMFVSYPSGPFISYPSPSSRISFNRASSLAGFFASLAPHIRERKSQEAMHVSVLCHGAAGCSGGGRHGRIRRAGTPSRCGGRANAKLGREKNRTTVPVPCRLQFFSEGKVAMQKSLQRAAREKKSPCKIHALHKKIQSSEGSNNSCVGPQRVNHPRYHRLFDEG